GKVFFPDFWDFMCLNLDRAAGEKMGLGVGSVMDLEALGRKFTIVYLGNDIQYGLAPMITYKQIVGNDRTLAQLAGEPEGAIGTIVKRTDVEPELLCCMRVKSAGALEKGQNEKWLKTVITLRPNKIELRDLPDFGKWKQDGKSLHATVLLKSSRYMSLNLDS